MSLDNDALCEDCRSGITKFNSLCPYCIVDNELECAMEGLYDRMIVTIDEVIKLHPVESPEKSRAINHLVTHLNSAIFSLKRGLVGCSFEDDNWD